MRDLLLALKVKINNWLFACGLARHEMGIVRIVQVDNFERSDGYEHKTVPR